MSERLLPTLMTLAEAAALLPGATLVGGLFGSPAHAAARASMVAIRRVHTDSRSLKPGDLFVALHGERFDGHDFLPQAAAAGAVAAIAGHGLAEAGLPGLQVADPLLALQQLAAGWRAGHALPLIAVTGSNGKTTVTQMIASILRAAHGEQALATAGNLNNHIGLPLTLLRLRPEHQVAVVELGMNHPGEIAELAALARPTVALVNNAQREHQEFMQSVEAVARENGAVIDALPADGTAVFPADDDYSPLWLKLAGPRRVMRFALGSDASAIGADAAEVRGQATWVDGHWQVDLQSPAGPAQLLLRVAGRHNVKNALAAVSAALAAGIALDAVVSGLNGFSPVAGRSVVRPGQWRGQALTLIDDSYNANPDSVRAAIEILADLPAPRWLILGDMGEVGQQGPEFHAEIGAYARARGVDGFWSAGPLCAHAAAAYGAGARHFGAVDELIAALSADGRGDRQADPRAFGGGCVLVKGSRFMKMERVVAALAAPAASALAPTPAGGRDAA